MRSILGHEYARFCISRREAILILTLGVAREISTRGAAMAARGKTEVKTA